jgi:multiple sugar transport system permease protein
MAKEKVKVKGLDRALSVNARRTIAYITLVFISVLCLFWFYILFVNSTRSHGEMTKGFTPFPSTHLWENWINGVVNNSTINFVRGMFNSLFVATSSALLCTYFSTMTAYAIHAYRFKGREFIFTFILLIMTIPTQISAMGFIDLIDKMKLMNTYIPLIVPAIAAPSTFFFMKQYMDGALPLSLIEAARIDGSGEFNTFNSIVLPLMKPAIAVQIIFGFVGNWNNYFTPALVLKGDKATLPVMIALLRSAICLVKEYCKKDSGTHGSLTMAS